jgi:hypothetical protein
MIDNQVIRVMIITSDKSSTNLQHHHQRQGNPRRRPANNAPKQPPLHRLSLILFLLIAMLVLSQDMLKSFRRERLRCGIRNGGCAVSRML